MWLLARRLDALGAVDEDLLLDVDMDFLSTPERRATWVGRLGGLLGREVRPGSVLPVIKHGSGSVIAAWWAEEGGPAHFVWIDSGGSPRAVFARSFDELVRLLPHGLGFIYDVLAAVSRGAPVDGHSSPVDVARWTAAGFEPDPTPAAAIKRAFDASPRFESWLGA